MKPLRIVFFGTPDFAVPALDALVQAGHNLSLVVTQPDRPRGRGRKLAPPPVKSRALDLGCAVAQPESMQASGWMDQLRTADPDVLAVVAYGRLLPAPLLALARRGAVNVHASLLPKYRGSAPIQWAIINQETETGVTTMLLDSGMDTGDMLMQHKTPIDPQDTAGSLHDRLAQMGASLLTETLAALAADTLVPEAQDPAKATWAPMLKKSDGRIDWTAPAAAIDALIRGTNPWPGAHTFAGDRRLKIFAARVLPSATTADPGTVVKAFSNELRVATGSGLLRIDELQGASGKRMPIDQFLRGYPIPPGTRLH